ncbi:MAG TPA: SusC/RagA family TonB-linked outer membrane protein [Longimicrobiales bacterium]|nr:SusC/RagA family TonB-linked outer membrane protein [Longimicrobiales bacterium]
MRRGWLGVIGAVALLLGAGAPAAGQQGTGTIIGQVFRAEDRQPVVGAQVVVVGTRLGALAAAEGRFVIRGVPVGSRTVRVQVLGYTADDQTVAVTAGTPANVVFTVKEQAVAVAPVVVTALGISRSEKSLGYAVQSISAQALARSPETTLTNALAGQSAGVSVVSSSGRPGSGTRITIRGESSFTGSGQPLFVIDGMPVSTDTDGPRDPLGTGTPGSRAMDLDMENIEEISVLRGAAATALYGSRAANGAVIIKTKQGKAGQPLRFQFNTEAHFDRPILEGYTTDYAAGLNGYFCNGKPADQGGWCQPGYPSNTVPNPLTMNDWGPHKDSIPQIVFDSAGPVRFRDAREDFYRTALTTNSSLRGIGSMGDAGTYTFGISYLNQGDISPDRGLDRLNLNTNINLKLSDWLNSQTSVERIRTTNSYNNDSYNGITRSLINVPSNVDIRHGSNADGTPILWGSNYPSYQWVADNEYQSSLTNRWIVSQRFALAVVPGLTLSNQWGLDTYLEEARTFQNERPWLTAAGQVSGLTQQRKSHRTTINNDLVLSLDTRPLGSTGITFSALVGGNLYSQDFSQIYGTGQDILIPDYYNVSNFQRQTVRSDLPTQRRVLGAYGQATFDYGDWAFLALTGRNDWSSTLPINANHYFYPSASLGVVFTDALGWRSKLLDYGKLRFSVAKVGNDAPPYQLSTRYVQASAPGADNAIQQNSGPRIVFPFRGQTGYWRSNSLGNPDLKPESTVETELGLELRMFDNRARAEVSLYNKSSFDEIFSVPSSSVTGYTSITRNAGSLRNRGIEVSLQGRPVQLGRFSWDLRANWSMNRSHVIRLAPGVNSISLAGFSWPQVRIMEGYPYGVIWGYGFKRNCVNPDPNTNYEPVCFQDQPVGTLLIGDDGFPIRTDQLMSLGSVMPNWTGNLSTDLRYRGLGLSALVDIRNGGKILNFEQQYTVSNGRSKLTETRNTPYKFDGVNINTGEPNDVTLIRDRNFYNLVYGFDRHENQVEPAGFVKLREVTLSYIVPERYLRHVGVQGATLYVTGRNLKVWTDFSLGDPEGDPYGGTNAGGQYFRWFSQPQTRAWVVGIRGNF